MIQHALSCSQSDNMSSFCVMIHFFLYFLLLNLNVNLGSVYAIFCSLFGRNSWVIQVSTFSNRRPKIQEMKCAYFSRPFFLLFEWLDDSWSSKIPLTIKSKKRVYDEAATTCLKFRGSRLPFLTHVHYRVCSIKGPEISAFKKALDFD